MTEFKIEKNRFKRYLYLVLGIINVVMGFIGIFVPVWPTTIFLILAAWFFVRSSEKHYQWLIKNKLFGKMIRNYREFKGITRESRRNSIIILWVTLTISAFFVELLWVRILLACVGIAVSWHLLALHTLTDEEIAKLNDENTIIE
ncbi:MAG: YbaN family protein [Candidatus Kapabacteria bacterium]|nr:YbaN family protein [Candidatus Kapabacteria bacterium]